MVPTQPHTIWNEQEHDFVLLNFHSTNVPYKIHIFCYIAPVSVEKMKKKMRRKARALRRWQERNEISGENAAMAFIRIFNRKLFECTENSDLTWSRWFFPAINTDSSLRVIDNYAQDCVRFLVSGKRTKARFNVRYEDIRRLGLRSLVHEYYKQRCDQ